MVITIIITLVAVRQCLTVVLIRVSLMISDASFHVLVGSLCISFREMSIQILYPLFNWAVCLFGAELVQPFRKLSC